jgi:hypothetical protein
MVALTPSAASVGFLGVALAPIGYQAEVGRSIHCGPPISAHVVLRPVRSELRNPRKEGVVLACVGDPTY